MSDDPNTDIARRLRAEGQAQAPADLRSEVMAQVAAEPRRRRARQRRLWRPVLAAAAVACALGGAAIGASNLGGSSQSTGLATRAAAEADLGSKSVGPSIAERVYTISAGDARKLLHSSAAGTLSRRHYRNRHERQPSSYGFRPRVPPRTSLGYATPRLDGRLPRTIIPHPPVQCAWS